MAESTDLETDLAALAGDYLRAVLKEPVVQLRRLVIGEANRLPELAQLYYERAPARTLAALTDASRRLHDRGILYAPEPSFAAEHFAFLIVGRPIDQALFDGAPRCWPVSSRRLRPGGRRGVSSRVTGHGRPAG